MAILVDVHIVVDFFNRFRLVNLTRFRCLERHEILELVACQVPGLVTIILVERLRQILLEHFVVLAPVSIFFVLIKCNFLLTHEHLVRVQTRRTLHILIIYSH